MGNTETKTISLKTGDLLVVLVDGLESGARAREIEESFLKRLPPESKCIVVNRDVIDFFVIRRG